MEKATTQQYMIRYSGSDEAAAIYAWLTQNGYRNPQGLTPEGYTFPVIVVDEFGEFFGTNVTCMAAAASSGKHAISFEEFKRQIGKAEGRFIVEFTHGDRSRKIGHSATLEDAKVSAIAAQNDLRKKGKTGMITVYEITSERGRRMQKIHEFYEV